MNCPDENTLLDYVQGRLTVDQELDEHLDGCPDCRDVVGTLIGRRKRRHPTLQPGERAGRFVIEEVLGRGGMGVVYAAHDDELGRKVAVKVLRVREQEHATRLAREAQAIARVSHPNVVAVYQIGTLDGGALFVAMELVRGLTLRQWLPREPKAVLDVMLAAGRGLAAAHRVGVVHRDFKPDNVMIADDGATKVLDFGLALAGPWSTTDSGSGEQDTFDLRLTATGTVMGTPAYMAPEQHEGRVDERSDQFAFCVALYEALFEQRPFEGDSVAALAEAKQRGVIVPRRPGVSNAVRAAIVRGLAPEPDARFESIDALLAALEPRASGSARTLALATAAVVLSIGGWAIVREPEATLAPVEAAPSPTRLSAAEQAIVDEARDARTRGRFADAHATCDGALGGDPPPAFAAALHLERGLARLATSDPADAYTDFERAFELGRSIGDDDLAARAALMAARVGTTEAARPVDAEQWLRHAEPHIERAGSTPRLRLEQAITLARVVRNRGDAPVAEQHARTALALAEEVGDPMLESTALSELAGAVWTQGRREDAQRFFEREIELIREELGPEHPSLASALVNLGACLFTQKDLDGAQARVEEGLRVADRSLGPTHSTAGFAHMQLGRIAMAQGDPVRARASMEKALAIVEARHGEIHPFIAQVLYDLTLAHFTAGTFDEAEPLLWRAVSVLQTLQGEKAPGLAYHYSALADIARYRGEPARALELREQALAIVREHPQGDFLARVLIGHAHDLLDLERPDEAEESLASLERSEDRDGPLLFARGRIALARGRVDEAIALLDQSLETTVGAVGPAARDREDLRRVHAEALRRKSDSR